MQPIKAARVFRCELPASLDLPDFAELGEAEFARVGFMDVLPGQKVVKFPGGYVFKVRYDEKIVPASVTTREANKRILLVETEEDRRLQKKERAIIREKTYTDLLRTALVKSTGVACFYNDQAKLLLVATSGAKLGDTVISTLIKHMGAVKFTSIVIDGIKQSFTNKLQEHLQDGRATFENFDVAGTCKLKADKQTVSFKMDDLAEAKEGILDAISKGFVVSEIGLQDEVVEFKIDDKFVLKGIHFAEQEPMDFDSEQDAFIHEASFQTLALTQVIETLCTMFESELL